MLGEGLAGKRVLLSGATGGIGRETARVLTKSGARLFLIDRDAAALAVLIHDLAACGGQTPATAPGHAVCDVTRASEVARAHTEARRHLGQVDAAVLNAGIAGSHAPFGQIDPQDLDRVMAVNVSGVLHGLNDLMPAMIAQRAGAIVILGSSARLRGARGYGTYVASKHAVIGLMRCAALEGAGAGVRVMAVAPGPTDTAMIEAIDRDRGAGDAPAARRTAEAMIPQRRYGRPEEITQLIAFLLSDGAGYCNGAIYQADGGVLA